MSDSVTVGSSTLREDQARAVRERILSAVLAVIEAGEEPTMRAVARAAQISERTLYRYYPSLDELQTAALPLVRERASAPMAKSVEQLPEYISQLFTTFDNNERLTRALVTAAWAPTNVTRPANLRALRCIIDAAYPDASVKDRESAAASLRVLYSAAGWLYLNDCGFDLEASVRHVQWNTRAVLRRFEKGQSHA